MRNWLALRLRGVHVRAEAQVRGTVERTFGKTKNESVSNHGNADRRPQPRFLGPQPQQARRTNPRAIAKANTRGESIVNASWLM